MNYAEVFAAAEYDLREAFLLEFLKPELPEVITLVRHAERYLIKRFDALAQMELEDLAAGGSPARYFNPSELVPLSSRAKMQLQEFGGFAARFQWEELLDADNLPALERYCAYIAVLKGILPDWFFGCREYSVDGRRWPEPGSQWRRCIEYGTLARLDHSNLPGAGDDIFSRYGPTNGNLFLKYGLRTRLDYWRSKATLLFTSAATPRKHTRIIVDDQHKRCLDRFDEILKTTSIEKWSVQHKIDQSQVKDYKAGKFMNRVSDKKRAEIEAAILE